MNVRLYHHSNGVTGLQAGVDLGCAVDLQSKRGNLLGGEPLGFDGHGIGADGQKADGVDAGPIGLCRRFHRSRSVFSRDVGADDNGSAGVHYLAGDRTGDRLARSG